MPKNCCEKFKEFCRSCKKCCYFWYALVIFGMILSLYITVSSLKQIVSQKKQVVAPENKPAEQTMTTPSGKVLKYMIGNITGEQAAVAFTTESKGQASVYLVENNIPTVRYTDDRGETTTDKVHFVTLKNLQPETDYFLKICTDFQCDPAKTENWYGINGNAITFRTGAIMTVADQEPKIVYGKADSAGGGLISLNVQTGQEISQALVAIINPQTGWALDLANARTADGTAFFPADESSVVLITLTTTDNQESTKEYPYSTISDQPINLSL